MAYQQQELGLLVRLLPTMARDRILAALAETNGNVARAAEHLRVGERTLFRWIDVLDMRDAVLAVKLQHGQPARGRTGT